MKDLKEIIGDYQLFLDNIFFKIEDIDLEVDDCELDHICYRVENIDEYNLKKEELSTLSKLLTESTVNGRNIATFKLNNPIEYKNRKIYLIELPAPKEEKNYKSGLEHIEFVTKLPLEKIVARYPHLAFETYGINKRINADVTLKLGEFSLRFHNLSLEDVIKGERPKISQANSSKNNHHKNSKHQKARNHGRPKHHKK